MRRISLFLVTLVLSAVVSITLAQSEELTIVASHSILADVVANVAGDVAIVETLIPLGADPHAFQPSTRDLTRLASADIIFINGGLFEEGLIDTIENVASETEIVVASLCVEIRLFAEEETDHNDEISDSDNESMESLCDSHYSELEIEMDSDHRLFEVHCQGDDFHEDEHEDEHEGEHQDEDEHNDEHEHSSSCDPHVWTIPRNVMLWTLLIRDELIEQDPTNAAVYQANAFAYVEQLQELEVNFIQPSLESVPAEQRILITNHDSFGYFADAYSFEIISTIIPGGTTLTESSASSIVNVIEQINATGVSAIFSETTMSDDIAQQIANETGAEIYQLYSGALGQVGSPASTYIDYMRYNVSTIVNALAGN